MVSNKKYTFINKKKLLKNKYFITLLSLFSLKKLTICKNNTT